MRRTKRVGCTDRAYPLLRNSAPPLLRGGVPVITIEELITVSVRLAPRTNLCTELHYLTRATRLVHRPLWQPGSIGISALSEVRPI